MARRKLSRLIIFCALKNPVKTRILLFLLFSIFLCAALSGNFSADISAMLPDHARSAKIYTAILRSGMFNKIVIEFHLPEHKGFEQSGLPEFLPRLERRLEKIPNLRMFGFPAFTRNDPTEELVRCLPQLVPAEQALGNDAFCREKASEIRRRLLMPGQTALLRNDPFSLLTPFFRTLERFRAVSGIRISPRHFFPVSEDGRHAMVLLETTVPVSDSGHSTELLRELETALRDSPVPFDLVTAHKRAAVNESILKQDLKTIAVTSFILFALIFLVVYRKDFRSFAIPLIPLAASVVVLGIMTLIFRKPLLFVIGTGGIVISLAADYGIHIYSAITGGRGLHGFFRIIPPLSAGAATSAAVFLLFLISGTEGFRQFGFFASLSLLLSLVLMILLLPPFFAEGKRSEHLFRMPEFPRKHAGSVIAAWILLTLSAAGIMSGTEISRDIRQFDAAQGTCGKTEEAFRKHFLSAPPAVVLVQGTDRNEVESRAEKALETLRSGLKDETVFSPLELWPSGRMRNRNLGSWKELIRSGKFEEMKRKFRSALRELGMPEQFAEPFFEGIERGVKEPPEAPPALFAASERFRSERNGYVTIGILAPDTPENIDRIETLLNHPAAVTDKLPEMMAADILGSMALPGTAALIFVVLITFLYFRNIGETVSALLPAASSLLAAGAFFVLAGIGINLAVLTSAVILTGLSVDYGIFMTTALRRGKAGNGSFHAVTLSALTTAAGGCTVIFTTHPMLRYAGISLIVGISAAWFTGVFLLPALKNFKFGKAAAVLLVPAALCLDSCSSAPFEYEEFSGTPDPEKIAWNMPEKILIQSRVTVDFRFHAMTFLTFTELDEISGSIHIVALSPAGVKILDIRGTPQKTEKAFWMKGGPWDGHEEQASRTILEDAAALYRNKLPAPILRTQREKSRKRLKIETETGEFIYAASPPILIERVIRKDGEKIRRIRFYRRAGGIPDRIYMENLKYGYRLTIRTDRMEKLK